MNDEINESRVDRFKDKDITINNDNLVSGIDSFVDSSNKLICGKRVA